MSWEGAPCSMKCGESGQASLRKEHFMRHWKEVTSGLRAFQASQQLEPRAGGWGAGGGLRKQEKERKDWTEGLVSESFIDPLRAKFNSHRCLRT